MTDQRNVQAINELADFIEQHKELPFDMTKPYKPDTCGTAGCIGGFAAALWPEDHVEASAMMFDLDAMSRRLGFDCYSLCYWFHPQHDHDLEREEAVAKLRSIAQGGRTDWYE